MLNMLNNKQPLTEAEGMLLLKEIEENFADDTERLHEAYDAVAERILMGFAPDFAKAYSDRREQFWYA